MTGYLERLAARTAATGTTLCVGVDPDPASLPVGFPPTLAGVERFARLIVEAALPFTAAVKPNLAFFEAFGAPGIAALERLRAMVPATVPFVADAKRGDIGTTASRQAIALFDELDADAITVNPYLGAEALEPLIGRVGRFAYVLCRTSNPGAAELQGLEVAEDDVAGHPAEPLWARVARRAETLGARWDGWSRGRGDGTGRAPRDTGPRPRARVPGTGCRCPGWRDRARPCPWASHRAAGRGRSGWRAARERLPGHHPSRNRTTCGGHIQRPGRAPRRGRRGMVQTTRCATLTAFGPVSRPGPVRGSR